MCLMLSSSVSQNNLVPGGLKYSTRRLLHIVFQTLSIILQMQEDTTLMFCRKRYSLTFSPQNGKSDYVGNRRVKDKSFKLFQGIHYFLEMNILLRWWGWDCSLVETLEGFKNFIKQLFSKIYPSPYFTELHF